MQTGWFLIPLLAFGLAFPVLSAHANQLKEIKTLDFGVFAVMPSGSPRRIVIDPNGAQTMPDGGLVKLRAGHNAVIRITQADPLTLFYITINNALTSSPSTLNHLSGSPTLDIDSFEFDPPNDIGNMIHVDPDGSLDINIGATLTVPAAMPNTPGPYRGTYIFMINF